MLDASQPPVEQEPEEGDPSPYPEDEELFVGPDVVAAMEEAIGKFLDGLARSAGALRKCAYSSQLSRCLHHRRAKE